MSDDLVKRLQDFPTGIYTTSERALRDEIASRIAALEAERDRLRKALEPFAGWSIGGKIADDPENAGKYPLLVAAILKARAALAVKQ